MKSICTILVDRANYGRLRPVMAAIQASPALSLSVIAGGSMVLQRFKRPADMVRADGFDVVAEVYHEVEGSTPLSMAKSIDVGAYATELARLQPDFVLLIGDRYEALAAATAARTLGIKIVHLQGGERSGALDDRWRDAISMMADYHWPATAKAAERVESFGHGVVLGTGCPSSDLAFST